MEVDVSPSLPPPSGQTMDEGILELPHTHLLSTRIYRYSNTQDYLRMLESFCGTVSNKPSGLAGRVKYLINNNGGRKAAGIIH